MVVSLLDKISYSAVNKRTREGTALKTLDLYLKHLPKLHLTHKSLTSYEKRRKLSSLKNKAFTHISCNTFYLSYEANRPTKTKTTKKQKVDC